MTAHERALMLKGSLRLDAAQTHRLTEEIQASMFEAAKSTLAAVDRMLADERERCAALSCPACAAAIRSDALASGAAP